MRGAVKAQPGRRRASRQDSTTAGLDGERRLDEKLLALAKPKLLIVDELGYLTLEPDAAHLFFQLVSRVTRPVPC